MKKILLATSILLTLTTTMCKKDNKDGDIWSYEKGTVLVDQEEYQHSPADKLTIDSVGIDGDMLTIRFAASGCDGKTWETQLLATEHIQDSIPNQRTLRLSLKNEESCDAIVSKTMVFNIKNVRIDNYDTISLHIRDYASLITYGY